MYICRVANFGTLAGVRPVTDTDEKTARSELSTGGGGLFSGAYFSPLLALPPLSPSHTASVHNTARCSRRGRQYANSPI